ncbi:RidA family protein [Paracoccus marcusii]|nr:RidA family protein [Paracoccus marcusii]
MTDFGTVSIYTVSSKAKQETCNMERKAVNPWDWSIKLGYNQAEIIDGATRQLICAGQTGVDREGNPLHPGDMRGQIGAALDNLEAVLKHAGMNLSNVVKLGVFATDVDEALKNFDLMGMRFGPHQVAPPMTLLGVTRLAIPGLLFEIEATALA